MLQNNAVRSHDYREIGIPVIGKGWTTRNYRHILVDLNRREAREKLINLSDAGISGENYYHRHDGLNPPYYRPLAASVSAIFCRETVARKLVEVNRRLTRYGVEVFVLDGYRPLACQLEIWNYVLGQVRMHNLGRSEDDIVSIATEYCSDPRGFDLGDSSTWPTHITGGAVDLTLRRIYSGELLFMGGTFDDPSPISHTSFFESRPEASLTTSDIDALRNRRLLYWAMAASDFVNYPLEWWHFDWGTQMWAALNFRSELNRIAVYGPAE